MWMRISPNYKSEHLLPDVQAASSLYMSQSAENKKEIQTLTNQLATAQFIRRELGGKEMNQPLPTNSGIANVNIESQIGEYNKMVLDRNRLIANSSEKKPVGERFRELNAEYETYDSSIG